MRLGRLEVSGSVNAADLTPANLLSALPHEACQFTGRLDLVRLAALFPATLSLRPGTEITAGELNLSLISQPADGGGNWTGTLSTSDLEAMAGGRPLAWKQPLKVDFRCRDAGSGLIVDRLECTSTFLHVEGSGTAESFTATAEFDLAQLATELGRFVDLASLRTVGHRKGQRQLPGRRRRPTRAMRRRSEQFRPRHSQSPPLARAAGGDPRRGGRHTRMGARSGRWPRPVCACDRKVIARRPSHPAGRKSAVGHLANPARLARRSGRVAATGRALVRPGRLGIDGPRELFRRPPRSALPPIEVQQANGTLQQLHLWGHGLFLDEPSIELTAAGRWQRAGNKIEIPLVGLNGGGWVARLNNAQLDIGGTAIQANGGATLQADLATIGRWLVDPRTPLHCRWPGSWPAKPIGRPRGRSATLRFPARSTTFRSRCRRRRCAVAASAIDNLNPLRAAQQQFQPRHLPRRLAGTACVLAVELDFDQAADTLTVSQGQLAASAVEGQLEGKIADLTGTPDVELSGQIVADWGRLAPLWKPYAGPKRCRSKEASPGPFRCVGGGRPAPRPPWPA